MRRCPTLRKGAVIPKQPAATSAVEIAAEVAEAAFASLDAPPARVGGADLPIAFSKAIEQGVYSAQARLAEVVRRTLAY